MKKQKEDDKDRVCKRLIFDALHLICNSNKVSELQNIKERKCFQFFIWSFICCFSNVLALSRFVNSLSVERNKMEKEFFVETVKQNIFQFLSINVLKFIFGVREQAWSQGDSTAQCILDYTKRAAAEVRSRSPLLIWKMLKTKPWRMVLSLKNM